MTTWHSEPAQELLLGDHNARHENGGADEVSVAGLSGLLADDQHVLDSEVTAVAGALTLYDAQSILAAVSDNTPVAVTVGEQTLVGRITSGNITALTVAQVITLLGVPQFAKAMVIMDLSGGAVSNVIVLHTSRALTLLKAIILYTEASSADAGVTITIGKESDLDYYYTGASEISQAQWYEKDVTLLATDVAAGDTVICGIAGGKVGTGEVLITLEYKVA